ncbi:hypothetical protein NL108_010165, partial [Boleophthalmus pectinirostris]
ISLNLIIIIFCLILYLSYYYFVSERMCKKCSEGWTLFQSKCYYFSSRTLSWSSSRAWCQTHRAELVIINSEEEQV